MNLQNLHDEIMQYFLVFDHKLKNEKFQHPKHFRALEGTTNGYEFKLAADEKELMEWGQLMRNCVGSYADKIRDGSVAIFGVFKGKKLVYNVKVNSTGLMEAKKFANNNVDDSGWKLIRNWFSNLEVL